jgi:hypothetical protein
MTSDAVVLVLANLESRNQVPPAAFSQPERGRSRYRAWSAPYLLHGERVNCHEQYLSTVKKRQAWPDAPNQTKKRG